MLRKPTAREAVRVSLEVERDQYRVVAQRMTEDAEQAQHRSEAEAERARFYTQQAASATREAEARQTVIDTMDQEDEAR
jgi:hypothetical protein